MKSQHELPHVRALDKQATAFLRANRQTAARPKAREPVHAPAMSPFDRLHHGGTITSLQHAAGRLFERDHEHVDPLQSNFGAIVEHMQMRVTRGDPGAIARRLTEEAVDDALERGTGYELMRVNPTAPEPSTEPDARNADRADRLHAVKVALGPASFERLSKVIVDDTSLRGLAASDGSRPTATRRLLADLDALARFYVEIDGRFARATEGLHDAPAAKAIVLPEAIVLPAATEAKVAFRPRNATASKAANKGMCGGFDAARPERPLPPPP